MAYTKTTWANDVAPFINASNLNHLETGVSDVHQRLDGVVSVKEYGAIGDGSADDTTAINNAMAALPSRGGTLFFPPGSYKVTSTIVVAKPLTILGSGFSAELNAAYNAQWLPATEILWTNVTGAPVFQVVGPLGGVRFEAFGINGNAQATKGFELDRLMAFVIRDVGVKNLHSTTGIAAHFLATTATTNQNCQHGLVENFYAMSPEILRFSGSNTPTVDTANCCHIDIVRLTGVFSSTANNHGIVIQDADNLNFENIMLFRNLTASSGYAVEYGTWARAIYMEHLQPSGGVVVRTPATNNTGGGNLVVGYDRENNQPMPMIEAGGILDWTESGRNASNGWTVRDIGGRVNVVSLGADPSGVRDSAPAIQAAITYLQARGGVVEIPRGLFKISSSLVIQPTVTTQRQSLTIRGAGMGAEMNAAFNAPWKPATEIIWDATSAPDALIKINGISSQKPVGGLTIERLGLNGNEKALHGIVADRLQFSNIRDVGVIALSNVGKWPQTANTTIASIADPTVAPTVAAVTDAGSTLPAGRYFVRYSWEGLTSGESLPSPSSVAVTVTSGQAIRLTISGAGAAHPSGGTYSIYTTGTNDVAGSERLYKERITLSGSTTDVNSLPDRGCGLWLQTTGTTANENSQHNSIDHFFAGICPVGIRLSGNTADTANAAHNTFRKISLLFSGDGVLLDNCDNNTFFGVWTWRTQRQSTGRGRGVVLGKDARSNYFYHLQPDFGVFAGGSETSSSTSNTVMGYDRENGQPFPTVAPTMPTPTSALVSGGSLTATTTYYYKVSAYDSAGRLLGTTSEISRATDASNRTIKISGFAVPGASQYQIYRGTTSGANTTAFLATVPDYSDANTDTAYTVTAPQSTFAANLTWTEDGRNSQGWRLPRIGLKTYRVPQSALALGASEVIQNELPAPTGVTAATAAGTGLAIGTHTFRVYALDALGGLSGPSQDVAITLGSASNVTITWSTVPGANSYRIFRAPVNATSFPIEDFTTTFSFRNVGGNTFTSTFDGTESTTTLPVDGTGITSRISGVSPTSGVASNILTSLRVNTDPGSGAADTFQLYDPRGTTAKYIRVNGGAMQIINQAFNTVLMAIADAGTVTLSGPLIAGNNYPAAISRLTGAAFSSTASVTVSTAVTATLVGSGVGSLTIPAAGLIAGRTVRLRAFGYLTTTASPSTLIFLVKLGSTTVANSNAGTALAPTASLTTAKPWAMECSITCRTTGASGTVLPLGVVRMAASATAGFSAATVGEVLISNTATPTTTTIDTTASQALDFQVTNAGTGTTVVCTNFEMEVLH